MKKNKNVSVSVFQFILCVYEALHTMYFIQVGGLYTRAQRFNKMLSRKCPR
jgi:hypothetical protein